MGTRVSDLATALTQAGLSTNDRLYIVDMDAGPDGKYITVGELLSHTGDVTGGEDGVLTIAADAIDSTKIADNAVGNEHLQNDAVDTAEIADSAVENAKIGPLAVTTSKLGTGAVTTVKLDDGSVTTIKLDADAVDGTKIADNSIGNEHMLDNSVDTAELVDGAVTSSKVGLDAVDGTNIADDSIDSEHYVDGSIDAAHLASSAVTTAKINTGAVTNTKIGADAVDGAKIADDAIGNEHLQDGAVDTAELADGAVNNNKLGTNSVGNTNMQNNSVDTAELVDGAVTLAKFQDLTHGEFVVRFSSGTGAPEAYAVADFPAQPFVAPADNLILQTSAGNLRKISGSVLSSATSGDPVEQPYPTRETTSTSVVLSTADQNGMVVVNTSGAATVDINGALNTGNTVSIVQKGAGQVTVDNTGITVLTPETRATEKQYSIIQIICLDDTGGSEEYLLAGQLELAP